MAVYLGENKVNMVGGQPIIVEGVDTSDATATASKILLDETAYVNGEKITGTLPYYPTKELISFIRVDSDNVSELVGGKVQINADIEEDMALLNGASFRTRINLSVFGDAASSDVVAGKIFTSSEGLKVTGTKVDLDTSDATATATDILSGKTAYVNGELVTGSIETTTQYGTNAGTAKETTVSGTKYIGVSATSNTDKYLIPSGSLDITTKASNFGNATAADVASGKTFTSSAGLKVTGTATLSNGLAVKTGTTTSATISTGLSSIDYLVLYKSSVGETGFIQGTYRADTGNTTYTYCSSYSTWSKAYAVAEDTNGSTSGGTFTWSGSSTQALSSGITYNWIAVGTE